MPSQTYKSPYGYQLDFPEEWHLALDVAQVVLHPDAGMRGRPAMVIRTAQTAIHGPDDLHQELQRSQRWLRSLGEAEGQVTETSGGPLTVGQVAGYRMELERVDAAGGELRSRIVGLPVSGGKTTILLISSNPASWPQFDLALSSFNPFQDAISDGYRRFASERDRFAIEFPHGWLLGKATSEAVSFRSPRQRSDLNNLVVSLARQDEPASLAKVAGAASDSFASDPRYTVSESEAGRMGGQPAHLFRYAFTLRNRKCRGWQAICIAPSGTVISVTTTSSEGEWAEYEPTFQHIVSSVSWVV